MRAKEFITESPLSPAALFDPRHLSWRPQNFLAKIANQTPFVDKAGNEYIAEPSELQRVKPIIEKLLKQLETTPNAPLPSILLKMQGVDAPVPVSKLEKADLQTAKGQFTSNVNVQPIGIGIATDPINAPGTKPKDKVVLTTTQEIQRALNANKGIVAADMYNVIASNQILDTAGELGQAIKAVAEQMQQGIVPDISAYDESIQKRIAIDAGEYLGILALASDIAEFPKQDRFLKFLGTGDFSNLTVIFPGEQNSSLSDSYGVQNELTGHTIMISSKGGKGSTATGAAPSLGGLAPSIAKRSAKIKKGSALDFINGIIQVSPTTVQGFAGINWLATHYPEVLPPQYSNLVPFYSEDLKQVLENIRTKGATPIPKKFLSLISAPSIQASKGTDGGKLVYVVTKDLVNIFNNSGLIEKFRKTILELLDENFIQIFTRIVGKKLVTKVLWPGKVDGNVMLHTKISPGEPGKAGLSFKVTD
jgi:hypothetical protein